MKLLTRKVLGPLSTVAMAVSMGVQATPVPANDILTTTVGQSISLNSVLWNDVDDAGKSLSITTITGEVAGTIDNTDGRWLYTPNEGFVGIEDLVYTVENDATEVETATIKLVVSAALDGVETRDTLLTGVTKFSHANSDYIGSVSVFGPNAASLMEENHTVDTWTGTDEEGLVIPGIANSITKSSMAVGTIGAGRITVMPQNSMFKWFNGINAEGAHMEQLVDNIALWTARQGKEKADLVI